METKNYQYALHRADNALIMAQRLSEWTGHGPSLEQDIAITNIALDLIGQARNFYQYAAQLATEKQPGKPVTEDQLAYLRREHEYLNLLLTELPNGDWGQTILKIYLFSVEQFFVYSQLIYSPDKQLAAIAEKSLKEVTYHVKWSGDWVLRLGDGTKESHERMQKALDYLWPYTGEMFVPEEFENVFEKPVQDIMKEIEKDWNARVKGILEEATLTLPPEDTWMQSGGKKGVHTEHLGYLLADLQYMQRTYPECEW